MPPTTSPSFCTTAWDHTAPLVRAIHEHPFNRALADGTLQPSTFAAYLVQDARYLVGFSRALAVASARTVDIDDAAFLADSAHTALVVERQLHSRYLAGLGMGEDVVTAIPTSPSGLAYSSYLQATALSAPTPVLVAALLPCFWVYADVGAAIHSDTESDAAHPYAAWIDTYADPDFAHSVDRMRDITDRAASDASVAIRAAMLSAFTRACEYEWLFWESAWRQEEWPTARWLPPDRVTPPPG